MSRYVSRIERDPETGEPVIVLPERLLQEAGWDSDTPLKWVVENGQVTIQRTKKAPRSRKPKI